MTRASQLALALLAAAAACGPRSQQEQEPAPEEAPTVVIFANRSAFDATVYLLPRGGQQRRIGVVPSGRTDNLTLPASAIPPGGTVAVVVRLLADPRTPGTGDVQVRPGERLLVTLPPEVNVLHVLPAAP